MFGPMGAARFFQQFAEAKANRQQMPMKAVTEKQLLSVLKRAGFNAASARSQLRVSRATGPNSETVIGGVRYVLKAKEAKPNA